MGLFDGFPFVSKEERERRERDFNKRITPFGVEAQRDKLQKVLKELFPKVDIIDCTFAYYDAKDAYTKKETDEEGLHAAKAKFRTVKWIDGRAEVILLRLLELERAITSLDEFPTAEDVLAGLFEE